MMSNQNIQTKGAFSYMDGDPYSKYFVAVKRSCYAEA